MRGSIRQRGNTHTAYWFTTDPATGKRVQHSKGGFRTRKAAREHLNVVLSKVQEGSWRPDRPLTVSELLEEHWLPAKRSEGRKPATIAQYEQVVRGWIVPRIGGVRVPALTPAMAVAFVDQLRSEKSSTGRKGLSARSAQLSVGVLKAACAWGVENGLLGRNPISGVRRPAGQPRKMTPWTVEQASAFLKAQAEDRLIGAWALLLTRGLRRGELCGLRWENVDLDHKRLTVCEARVVVEGKAISSTTKTGKDRTIPLDAKLVALLRAHHTRQMREKMAAGGAYEESGYVVADELGRPYHPDTISAYFERAAKDAGLPRIRLHDTRHTAASLMLAAGESVHAVAEILGHSSTQMVYDVYGHVMPGMTEAAGERLSALLLGD